MYEADIEATRAQIKLMVTYLLHKVEIQDWHGTYDSAIDIRCLSEKLEWMQNHDATIAAIPHSNPLR